MISAKQAKDKSQENNDELKKQVDNFLSHFEVEINKAANKGECHVPPMSFMESQLTAKGKQVLQDKMKDLGYNLTYKEDCTKKTFTYSIGW